MVRDEPRGTQRPAGVIIGRLLLLFGAAAALGAGLIVSQDRDRPPSAAPAGRYACPMHPQVSSETPGDCPICNMALERASDAGAARPIVAAHRAFAEVKRQIVAQVVRAPARVVADGALTAVVHTEAMAGLAPGDQAVFFRNAAPAVPVVVLLTSEPAAPWDSATVQAHFVSDRAPLRAGDTGWLELDARRHELLTVPESAVLYARDGAYVLAAPPGGRTFTRRSVQVGRILDSGAVADRAAERLGGIVVLSGLAAGERVVTGDVFVLDAERRLRAARGEPEEVIE